MNMHDTSASIANEYIWTSPDGTTGKVTATSVASARAKAWNFLCRSFQGYSKGQILIRKVS